MLDKIAIDLDGTIANSIPDYIEVLNRKFGYNFKYKDITKWSFVELGVKEEHIKELFSTAETFERLFPFVLAPGVIQYLYHNCNIHVSIITDRPREFRNLTRDWLFDYAIPYNKLVLLPAKDKVEYLFDNKIDVVVDDRPDMPELYNKVCEHVFLPTRLYNRSAKGLFIGISDFYDLIHWLVAYKLIPAEVLDDF